MSLNETITTPLGTFNNVVKTKETSEAEPGVVENKFYAAGLGEILTFEDINASGEPLNRIPLVSVTTASAVPLPPGAWAALAAAAMLLLPRGLRAMVRSGW